jgi:two-component system, OmpR family, phosphate regulon sensor histidine kinase PhoR
MDDVQKLRDLVSRERETALSRWRQQVRELPSARNLDNPTLNDHMPGLLEELAAALESNTDVTISEALAGASSTAHGLQRVQDAFDIEEVVAEYNILRACIHDLAHDQGLILQGRPFHIINRVFDQAIGVALQTYATQRALEVQRRREEYLAFVVHDLRTPLNAISLAAKVLERISSEPLNAPDAARMLNALRRNVQHLEKLVGKVIEENTHLQTEVGIKLERRDSDLWPLVESLIHDLHPVAGTASTRLINRVPDDLVVYADASLLRRVIQNLIANAIKYTPRGEIIIAAEELEAGGAVECTVSDNGAGIPEELREKIFDAGETDETKLGGTGLGLAIVKAFIEAHGGSVAVESTEGVGSTFRLSIPRRADGNAAAASHPTAALRP